MKLLKHRGKILMHRHRVIHHKNKGGNINHLIADIDAGGNISQLKKQLKHLIIKPKKSHRIKF